MEMLDLFLISANANIFINKLDGLSLPSILI